MDFLGLLEHHLLDYSIGLKLGPIEISKHVFMMMVATAILAIGLPLLARRWPAIPSGFRNFVEVFVVFIRDEIVLPNTGEEGRKYLPYFLTVFFFILTCNLLGMVPHSSTATGNIAVTAGLALATFTMIHFAGIRQYGVVHHFQNFIPSGLPIWLVPLMLPLELIGLLTKSFALCVRLFANMIAGHIVILALLSLIFIFGSMLSNMASQLMVAGASVLVATAVGCLELFVAFLQAYIFTFLSAIFVGSALHPH